MSNSILSIYYKGILGQLNSEVQLINRVFKHNGIKGEGNESALRDLLSKFIPKKYGISSGVVIDKDGSQSRQCDIIIYDNQNYPELLSMSSCKLFPVDIVYAVIEVKTSLDSSKSKIAIENINSVLSLNYIKETFRINPTEPVGQLDGNTTIFEDKSTSPPLGLVFSYETETNKLSTFLNWFKKEKHKDVNHIPSHVCSLDQGILLLRSRHKEEIPLLYPIVEGDTFQTTEDNEPVEINNKTFYKYMDGLHPYSEMGETKVLVDQGKTLLNFILILTAMLQRKHISPNLNFMEHYLTPDLKTNCTLKDGKLVFNL